ncbi:MAG TPA: hypothetical protein VJU80_07825 [Solirubrobacteraceae bacterium]|nr:hypothetical protein [Solirubrobacteraceae bacterium]
MGTSRARCLAYPTALFAAVALSPFLGPVAGHAAAPAAATVSAPRAVQPTGGPFCDEIYYGAPPDYWCPVQ